MGRSLPELTRAIVNSPIRPPSHYTPELLPELEQIILVAMARDRNERYEQAMLLSRDLRTLNLKPETQLSKTVIKSPVHANGQQVTRGKTVIQPPKRPKLPSSRYYDQEYTRPTVSKQAAHSHTPPETQQVTKASPSINEQKIDTEGPTGPLEPLPQTNTEQQQRRRKSRKHKTAKKRPLWQKIFKSPR
jgi:hypothetical protein